MKNKYSKSTDKIKLVAVLFALLLISITVIGIGLQVFGSGKQKPSEWFYTENINEKTVDDGMIVTTNDTNSGLRIAAALSSASDMGITELSDENTYTLTAVIEPAGFVLPLNWYGAWENADSEWATGKAPEDYVSVTSISPIAATVTCLKSFGERIIITVAVDGDDSLTATCTVDYKQKISRLLHWVKFSSGNTQLSFPFIESSVKSDIYSFDLAYTKRSQVYSYLGGQCMFVMPFSGGGVDVAKSAYYTIPIANKIVSFKYSLKLNTSFLNMVSYQNPYSNSLLGGTLATYFGEYHEVFSVDKLSLTVDDYPGFYLSDFFGVLFPNLVASPNEYGNYPIAAVNAHNGFYYACHNFAHNDTISDENKFNFYVKVEMQFDDATTFVQEDKFFINYTMPANSVSLDKANIIF